MLTSQTRDVTSHRHRCLQSAYTVYTSKGFSNAATYYSSQPHRLPNLTHSLKFKTCTLFVILEVPYTKEPSDLDTCQRSVRVNVSGNMMHGARAIPQSLVQFDRPPSLRIRTNFDRRWR